MNTGERYLALSAGELRLALEDLYADYSACLNEERFEDWPEFFTDPCLYKIVPRENFERGLPLATWLCESKGYLADRVTAIRKTAVYAPRYVRRFVSGLRVLGWTDAVLEVRASYLALESVCPRSAHGTAWSRRHAYRRLRYVHQASRELTAARPSYRERWTHPGSTQCCRRASQVATFSTTPSTSAGRAGR